MTHMLFSLTFLLLAIVALHSIIHDLTRPISAR